MLAILTPSRGRPHNMVRLAEACARTVTGEYVILCRLDEDDPTEPDYPPLPNVVYVTGKRKFYAKSLNQLASIADGRGATFLATLGDDVVPETVGWDQLLIGSLQGRVGVAFGSDGLEHKHAPDLPTHVVVPVELYRRLGWIGLPTLRHLFCDNVWRELGRGVENFQYVPEAKLSHLHRWIGAAPDDDTYREANDKVRREQDRRAFLEWTNGGGLQEALRALR